MMEKVIVTFFVGMGVGSLIQYLWFHLNGLIRSRSEWYGMRKAMGKKVPDNWEENW